MTNEQRSKLKPCPRCWHGAVSPHDSEGLHSIVCNRCGFWVRWEFYENDGEYSTEPGFANYRLHLERVKNSHPVYTFRAVEI